MNFKIIFYPGTHGHYVEFVLNKIVYGNKIDLIDPIGELGTSHSMKTNESYQQHSQFRCMHYDKNVEQNEFFIKIDFDADDDITVLQLNLKRGHDYNIDPDTLHLNTYNKLHGKYGMYGPDFNGANNIIDCVNQYYSLEPYYNIKDPAWPDIKTLDEFYNLPKHILNECIQVFGYKPVYINETYPDAPQWVLRSIFKSWFHNTQKRPSSIMKECDNFKNVYKLSLRNLYNTKKFKNEILNIGKYLSLDFDLNNFSDEVHKKFIDRVPYLTSKIKCETILKCLCNGQDMPIGQLNVVEQGYLNFVVEKTFNVSMPEEQQIFFKTTNDISNYIDAVK